MKSLKTPLFKNKWLIVTLLMLAYTFSFMDRYVVNLFVEPMKNDLKLTDTQVSMLLGLSFALFYATMGIPLGKLADTKSRTGIIAAGITLWSIMTALCGSARNYTQLILARMGVGIGEATLSPCAYSLIADYFPKPMWATAISIYSLGIYLGSGIAYIAGGKLIAILSEYPHLTIPIAGDIFGWQLIFILFGLPGLLIALLVLLVKEPERSYVNAGSKSNLGDFIHWIRKDGKLFLLLCLGSSIFNIAVYSSATWLPTYLKRIHHLGMDQAGLLLGLSTLLLPSIGVVAGGKIADLYAVREGLKGRLKILLCTTLLFIPANLFYPFTGTLNSTIAAMIPHGILISATVGMSAAIIQEIVPPHFRGAGSAVLLFSQNLIGMGAGPVSVGIMNDYIFHDPMAVGKSLLAITTISLSAAALIYTRTLKISLNFQQVK